MLATLRVHLWRLFHRVTPIKHVYAYKLEITTRAHQRMAEDMVVAKNMNLSQHISGALAIYSELLRVVRSGGVIIVQDEHGERRELVIDREHQKGLPKQNEDTLLIDI